ncbi:MAG: hypothetical protein KKG75_01870 [Nanoarchaeota archaeon]|nr:hypothetical protein [Nanoarchaeota archaeon]
MSKIRSMSWVGGSLELSSLVDNTLNSFVGKGDSKDKPEEISEDPIVVAVLDLCNSYLLKKLRKEGILRGGNIKELVKSRVNAHLGMGGYSGPDPAGSYYLRRTGF